MILKVVASVADTIANYSVTYDSGIIKGYSHKNKLPKSVIDFMRSHEPIKKQYGYWTQYTYIYTNTKGGNNED